MFFRKEYSFLSNFHKTEIPFTFEGIDYIMPTSENAFQAMKVFASSSHSLRKAAWLRDVQEAEPEKAKILGRQLSIDREAWDAMAEDKMLEIIRLKFAKGSPLAQELINLGDIDIVEDNNHGDKIWGRYAGKGENKLGKILKQVQLELINSWTKSGG